MENLYRLPHVGLIKIEPHFGGAHFHDKFITFGVASCIMVPDHILCMALFCEISCWYHISNYHTVVNTYNFTCSQLTPLRYTDVFLERERQFSTLCSMKMIFRYHSNTTHNWNFTISYFMRHFTETVNAIMKIWNTWSWWSLEVGTPPLGERPFPDYISCK